MSTVAKKRLNIPINKELELLRSFVIGMAGRDKEGDYRPGFVNRIQKAILDNPTSSFKNKKDFLKSIS